MCGIVALAPAGDATDIARAVATLAHRGPDGDGVWVSDGGGVALGHRRLAVIETSALGAQPMVAEDGATAIAFNGEIYNYQSLGVELDTLGHARRGGSDTAVILAAWRAWGPQCLARLAGMFAFALFDARTRKLHFARDRAGEKPLFYRHNARGLALASELKALLAVDPSPPRIDQAALQEYLAWGYVRGGGCLIAGYAKLPPATLATFDLDTGDLTFSRYWEPGFVDPNGKSDDDVVDGLDAVLLGAVRRQMVSDVPIGVLLSGGLDSSLIAAYAAEAQPGGLKTFTVSFPGSAAHDESRHAAAVARAIGSEHREIPLPAIDPGLIPTLARQVDEPIADPSLLPTAMLAQAVREHVTVALGGDGGDELFGGYPRYGTLARLDPWRGMLPEAVARIGRNLADRSPQHWAGRNMLRSAFDPAGSIGRFNVFFGPSARRALLPDWVGAASDVESARDALAPAGLSAPERAARADFFSYLPDEVLVKVDRASMLHSLEVRAPFLDLDVLEYAFRHVPWRLKADAQARKIILRRLAARRLPRGFDSSRKQGFTPPLAAWLRGPLAAPLKRTVDHLAEAGFARPALIDFASRPDTHANRLFNLMMLSAWTQAYGARL